MSCQMLSKQQNQLIKKKINPHYYSFSINTQPFKKRNLSLSDKIKQQYIPKYWKKLRMDQKRIVPNQQDRLSDLTTKQIDRIIDMEKIKSILNDKKNNQEEVFLDLYTPQKNKHSNVFRANFLSKINKIAIQRKIFRQKSQGFDQVYGEAKADSIRQRQLQKQKKNLRYVKSYKIDQMSKLKRFSMQHFTEKTQADKFKIDDQKSIESIEDKIQRFEQNIQVAKKSRIVSRRNSMLGENKLLSNKRWFEGMSTHYLQKPIFEQAKNKFQSIRSYDISGLISSNRKDPFFKNLNKRIKTCQQQDQFE